MKLLAEGSDQNEQGAPATPLAQLSTSHPMIAIRDTQSQVLGD